MTASSTPASSAPASSAPESAQTQTTLDALRLVEEYAKSIASRRVDASIQATSKRAIQTTTKSGLPEKERVALLQALLAVADATSSAREFGYKTATREAKELAEAAAAEKKALEEAAAAKKKETLKRARYALGAIVSLIAFVVAFCFREERVAYVAFVCFVAFVAPELVANIRGVSEE